MQPPSESKKDAAMTNEPKLKRPLGLWMTTPLVMH
jgi:hypothetical protein